MIDRENSFDTKFVLSLYRMGRYLKFNASFFSKPIYYLILILYKFMQILYGCSVPFNAKIGKGVCFKHGLHGVFISDKAIIGDNVIIMHQVTIGSNFTSSKKITAPRIGNNVFIGPGAKIIGDVFVSDNSKIGANALIVDMICNGVYVTQKSHCIKEVSK